MASELINKILEEIGLEPIDCGRKDEQSEDSCEKQPTPIHEQKT